MDKEQLETAFSDILEELSDEHDLDGDLLKDINATFRKIRRGKTPLTELSGTVRYCFDYDTTADHVEDLVTKLFDKVLTPLVQKLEPQEPKGGGVN